MPNPVKLNAYSVLEVKTIDDQSDVYVIRGIASTPTPDRDRDTVNPMGAKFKTPMPLLWQHSHSKPIGRVTFAKPTKSGIPYIAEIPKVKEAGVLKDRIDEAVQSVKYNLVTGVSIGFSPVEGKVRYNDERKGYDFDEWEWLELSLVTIPANAEATIASIKSLSKEADSASSGKEETLDLSGYLAKPSVIGKSTVVTLKKESKMKKTTEELITDFKAKREELAKQVQAMVDKSTESGASFDETESEEYDSMIGEIKSIDTHIARLEQVKSLKLESATPVNADDVDTTQKGANVSRSVIQVHSNLPKGTAFTRFAMCMAQAKGSRFEALELAKRYDQTTPQVGRFLKAATQAGTTTDADWASKLVDYTTMVDEFIELLRPMTILGKFGANGVPNLRNIPFNVRMPLQSGGGTYKWVGEGSPKPVGEMVIGEVLLRWAKASGIIVISDELARQSSPAAEQIVRRELLSGMSAFSDSQFIDPTIAEVSNVSPASILNGVLAINPSGNDADALRADIARLMDKFWAANLTPTSGVWIMSNRQATRISLMRNGLGQKEYPDMTPLGGTLEGFPVIASEHVPDASGGGIIAFVNADDVFYSDDGPVTIDVSREASLQMNDAPSTPDASTVMLSLWQHNLIGLRAERYMNWKKRRSAAAQWIAGANYS
jgi:HK97 family phage major capsid protein/HK97 family phage prohead protease